jgi:hypothetical protein
MIAHERYAPRNRHDAIAGAKTQNCKILNRAQGFTGQNRPPSEEEDFHVVILDKSCITNVMITGATAKSQMR